MSLKLYNFKCQCGHVFEAMVSSLDDFEKQKKEGFFTCPVCGSTQIEKALSAPYVQNSRQKVVLSKDKPISRDQMQMMLRGIQEIVEKAEYVGDKFATKARKIHSGEEPDRPIKGIATQEEVEELLDEGIPIVPVPPVKPDTIN